MSLDQLETAACAHSLAIFGTCPAEKSDDVGTGTIVLLGPSEPGFWDHMSIQPEMADKAENPIDRWSERVISALATTCNGRALFPFGVPPRPFITWALRSGRAWASPVGLLVHDEAGLMVSYRGAILVPEVLAQHQASASPCDTCVDQPCLSACPVQALTAAGYDLSRCHTFLEQHDGAACMTTGCAVRRTCPISQTYGRQPEQSGYHMAQFHRT